MREKMAKSFCMAFILLVVFPAVFQATVMSTVLSQASAQVIPAVIQSDDNAKLNQTVSEVAPNSLFLDRNQGLPFNLSYYYEYVRPYSKANIIIGSKVEADKIPANVKFEGNNPGGNSWILCQGDRAVWITGISAPETTSEIMLVVKSGNPDEKFLNGIAILRDVTRGGKEVAAEKGVYLYFALAGSKSTSSWAEVEGEAVETAFTDHSESLILKTVKAGTAEVRIFSQFWNSNEQELIYRGKIIVSDRETEKPSLENPISIQNQE
jgi:hypothetical protein